MVEKGPINESTETTNVEIDSDDELNKTNTAWLKLFSTFSKTALEQGIESTELEFEGSLDDDYFIKFHSPFSNERYQPLVINLDVYDDNSEHVQRVSGLAIWNENEPEIISINNHQMEIRDRFYNLFELANRASNIILLMEGVQTDESTGLPICSIFPIPSIYLDTIH